MGVGVAVGNGVAVGSGVGVHAAAVMVAICSGEVPQPVAINIIPSAMIKYFLTFIAFSFGFEIDDFSK
jgi:hypothetical protein